MCKQKCDFLDKVSIFEQMLLALSQTLKFSILSKISDIFQNFEDWPKVRFVFG